MPCDVFIHGAKRHPIELKYPYSPKSEAILYHNVRLWLDGECRSNFVLANVKGVKDPRAIITDEDPTLPTLWQYAMRFRIEELFLDSKSGVFELEESKIRQPQALKRWYLVVALALLFATAYGIIVSCLTHNEMEPEAFLAILSQKLEKCLQTISTPNHLNLQSVLPLYSPYHQE